MVSPEIAPAMSVAVSRRVWESSRHNGATFTVLLALADYADDEGVAYPSVTALAKKARLSERMTQYAIGQLKRSGEVLVEVGGGRHRTHRYVVRVSETAQPLHPIEEEETVQSVSERVQTTAERVQSDVGNGATVAPEPSVKNHQEPSPKNHQKRAAADPRIDEVFAYYRERVFPGARTCATDKIRARLKRFSVEELKRGIDNFAASPWSMKHNATKGSAWFFHSDERSEMYLHMQPDREDGPTPQRGGDPSPHRAGPTHAAPPGSLAARTKTERF